MSRPPCPLDPPPSRLRTPWLVAGWVQVGIVVWLSLAPAPPELRVVQGDKLGHLLAYGVVMFWFAQVYGARRRALVATLLVALGIGLEVAQGATGYRTFSLADIAADGCGTALGWLAAPPRLPNLLERVTSGLRRLAPG